jgi:hypothetical protein
MAGQPRVSASYATRHVHGPARRISVAGPSRDAAGVRAAPVSAELESVRVPMPLGGRKRRRRRPCCALRDWLRWRQDARAATDAGLPTCVPLGHVLLLHAWTSSQLAGPLVAALLALRRPTTPASFSDSSRLLHKPIRNPVHQLVSGITRAGDTHLHEKLGERVLDSQLLTMFSHRH